MKSSFRTRLYVDLQQLVNFSTVPISYSTPATFRSLVRRYIDILEGNAKDVPNCDVTRTIMPPVGSAELLVSSSAEPTGGIIVRVTSQLGTSFALPSSISILILQQQHVDSIFYREKDLCLGPMRCFVSRETRYGYRVNSLVNISVFRVA